MSSPAEKERTMDLISSLTSGLGIDPKQAQGLAGGVLGMVQSQLSDNNGPEAAAQMQQAIPEMSGWQQTASSMMGGGGDGGGMLGAAASAFGGGSSGGLLQAAAGAIGGKSAQQASQMVGLLGGLGLDAKYGAMAAPLILSFLKDRLPSGVLDMALQAAPMLFGGGEAPAAAPAAEDPTGGIAGSIGKLFGG